MADNTLAQPEPLTETVWHISDPVFEADEFKPEHKIWPWCGHRNFAYDLVHWFKPIRIAELGVHWGTSFFAWAQAIKDGNLPTQLIGVDTFKGEEHAGFYGEEVYSTVTDIVERRFTKQHIVLHRSLFDEALDHVENESCDIIHIDGLHTYEAVKHDFETWLPKLREHGVMLFHDTAESSGYGSADFWKELLSEYPGFAFEHSWGLGVLFPKGDRALAAIKQQNLADKIQLYTFKALFEAKDIANKEKAELLIKRMDAINSQTEMIRQRNATIEQIRSDLAAARIMCEERYNIIQNQSEHIANLKTRADNLDTHLAEANKAIASHTERIQSIEKDTQSLTAAKQQLETQLNNERAKTATLHSETEQLKSTISEHERAITDARQQLTIATKDLAHREERLKELNKHFETITLDLEALKLRAQHIESTHNTHQQQIDALDDSLSRGFFRKSIKGKPPT
ncbi:MAG: class I SAM-dependent methyltransferase [Phycisphaeraceae bacterium]|nr:class I SAM-dependent methyltransferase [Phycisphaerales bacterium]MCB9860663.1 class I SAM-dependent methyltransferase [Phycisphaeraceae bacterium]